MTIFTLYTKAKSLLKEEAPTEQPAKPQFRGIEDFSASPTQELEYGGAFLADGGSAQPLPPGMSPEGLMALPADPERTEARKAATYRKQAHLAAVSEITGWSLTDTRRAMNAAEKLGISYHAYRKNNCWTMSQEELEAFGMRRRERNADFVAQARLLTDCNEHTARRMMAQVDKSKLKRETYLKYAGWDLTAEELADLAEAISLRKKRLRKERQHYLDAVVHWTGWDPEYAAEHMDAARLKGISYSRYVQHACWTKDDQELERLSHIIKLNIERNIANKKRYVENIRRETGWSEGKTHLEAIKAQAAIGASYEDYCNFRLFELSPEEQQEYATLHDWNRLKAAVNNNAAVLVMLNDKAQFNGIFNDLVKRVWFINRDLPYEDFAEKIRGLDYLMAKPLAATQGLGVTKHLCNVSDEENRELYDLLMSREECIIEEGIHQHEDLAAFCPDSVNTVRVTTLQDEYGCHFLYAILRMGVGSAVDNFHAGGIAAGIDVETGKVETDAVDLDGIVYRENPATGKDIRGFQVPHWDQLRAACETAAARIPDVALIGWDFAITPDGVDLVEGNGGSGYVAVQMIYAREGKGLKAQLIDPWLETD